MSPRRQLGRRVFAEQEWDRRPKTSCTEIEHARSGVFFGQTPCHMVSRRPKKTPDPLAFHSATSAPTMDGLAFRVPRRPASPRHNRRLSTHPFYRRPSARSRNGKSPIWRGFFSGATVRARAVLQLSTAMQRDGRCRTGSLLRRHRRYRLYDPAGNLTPNRPRGTAQRLLAAAGCPRETATPRGGEGDRYSPNLSNRSIWSSS
jgi:hypothetical protein